jgi:hypothetical protein
MIGRPRVADHGSASPQSSAPRQPKIFSAKAFAEAWGNPDLTRDQIAASFGMSNLHTWRVAKRLGLPPRQIGPRPKAVPEAFIRAAWLAGVGSHEIAARAGISPDTLFVRAKAMGLALRGSGVKPKMTLMEFDEISLRERLAASAAETRAALINAEMADRVNGRFAA